ncbi:MAG: MBL fold metallo-hydrolase [Proteobacteria bacterium]|nr:MBL fold metallo-hydrolase [Pseudomonadota bacterium]MBU1740047.1 MBL fold metallo-hydrolase [Pseudomonadota bacterium]
MNPTDVEVLTLSLGTTKAFALKGDRVVLVDAGNPGDEGRILKRLGAAGIEPDQLSLILITHGHVDHFGAAAALKEATGAPVAVHPADADVLRRGFNPPVRPTGATGRWMKRLMGRFTPGSGPPVEPDVFWTGSRSWTSSGWGPG